MIEDHDVIEDVILHKGEGFTVFSIVRVYPLNATYPFVLQISFLRYSDIVQAPGILYWPSDTKIMGIERKDFMGKAVRFIFFNPLPKPYHPNQLCSIEHLPPFFVIFLSIRRSPSVFPALLAYSMLTRNQTLIAASDPDDLTTGFSGLQLKQQRKQKNLNRQSEAVIARHVTFVSIRAYLALSLVFISIPFLLFIPPLHSPAPSSSPAYIVSPAGFRTLFFVSCSSELPHSLASHLTPSAAAPFVPPSIQVTDTSTDTNANKTLPPRPLVDPLVRRNQRTVPVPVDAEVRLP
jgi:hypothetical protein